MSNVLIVDNTVPDSLNYAKLKIFEGVCFNNEHNPILGQCLKKNKHDFLGKKWTLRVGWFAFAKNKVKTAKLMKQDPNGKISNIYFNLGMNQVDGIRNYVYLEQLSRPIFGAIFDEICRLTNEGYSIGYYVTPDKGLPIRTKTFSVLLKPYQGSELLIEADLSSPDYAYLDAKINDVMFETETF